MAFYINEFLNNPAGKGSAVLNISATKEKYRQRYDEICKKIKHKTYFVKDDIYIIVNIPSSVDGIMYDVLLKFDHTSKSTGKTLSDMPMQIFSNSPSFIYTYAFAYNKQKLFIKECKKKLSSKMLSDIAKTRNPYEVLSYDFSVYASLFYIVNNGYASIDNLKMLDNTKCSLTQVLSNVKNAEVLQKNRKLQKTANKLAEEEKLKKAKSNIGKKVSSKKDEESILDVLDTKKIKKAKTTKQVKKTKKI